MAAIRIALATESEREVLYRLRHEVYARELGQHPLNSEGRLRDALDLPIPVLAVVPTRFDQRLRIARDVLDAARNLCNGSLTSPVRENVALRELFGHRQPIRTYRPDSTGAADYATLATEVLERV